MSPIEFDTLPTIRFAHIFETEHYNIRFSKTENFLEISYIEEGPIQIQTDNRCFHAEKGDIICITRTSEIAAHAEAAHAHRTVGIKATWHHSENGLLLPIVTKHCKETEQIRSLIDSCIYKSYLYEKSPTAQAGIIFRILCEIDTIAHKHASEDRSHASLLTQRAKQYIHRHIHEPITQREIAEHLQITPAYLCNVFKVEEGMRLMQYINTVKLRNVETLMQQEHLKLYEAAERYGYKDPNYAGTLFKKLFGRNITDRPNRAETLISRKGKPIQGSDEKEA